MKKKKKFRGNYYPRARVHHLTIYMKDRDGELFMTSDQLKKCLADHDHYETYACILHDRDVYDAEAVYEHSEKNRKTYIERLRVLSDAKGIEEDETTESGYKEDADLMAKAKEYADEQFPPIERGQVKPAHWHVVLSFTQARGADEIARWFKGLNGKTLEPNWNEVKTGRGAVESAWLYLIHKNHPKKFQYSASDVFASFDYSTDIQKQIELAEKHERYHVSSDLIDDVVEEVLQGLSLNDAKKKIAGSVYIKKKKIFEDARRDYVMNRMPMPLMRQVYYVDSEGLDEDHGKGNLGKSACSKALAKQLAREFGADMSKSVTDLQEYIFTAGDAKVFLQDYDGQPILLIDEINATDFKRACKGVNGVKALLSPYPERKSLDKKHGSVVCAAKYIIMNGIQSFEAFKRDLAKPMKVDGIEQESEESVKEQFDRRFWGNIHIVDVSNIEFWINRGLFDNAPELQQVMQMIGRVNAHFGKIASGTTGPAQAHIEQKVLQPLLAKIESTQGREQTKISEIEDLTDEFLSMGEVIEAEGRVIEDGFLTAPEGESPFPLD